MKAKNLITLALLVFVAGSLGYMVVRENKLAPQTAPSINTPRTEPAADAPQAGVKEQIVVYYFHSDVRCTTCHKLESYAKEAIDIYFAKDVAEGGMKWMPTNVDNAGNEHFVKDYQLVTKAVILSKVVDGKQVAWKNLDQIWQLVSDKDKYLKYISDSIMTFAAEEQN